MRKIIIYITILALVFSCSGCGKEEEKPASTTVSTTVPATQTIPATEPDETVPEETEPPVEVAQQPMTSVYLPIHFEDTVAEDGTVIFRKGTQSMVLIVQDPDVADRIVLDFLKLSDTDSDTQDLISDAQHMHTNGQKILPLWHQTAYEPQRIDQNVMSLYGYYRAYRGGIHPDTVCKSVTYDLLTGNALTLTDILNENITMDTLYAMVTEALKPQASDLYPDYENLVSDLFEKSISEYTDWYLSSEGLCFYFSPYEIAAYAYGDIVATIPYSELIGTLNDAYFPPEQDVARGVLIQSAFDSQTVSQFTQIAEVDLGNSGRKVILHTDYSLQNIRITQSAPSIVSADYHEVTTVFGAAALTPGDAIVITIPEGIEATISYIANGEVITETI